MSKERINVTKTFLPPIEEYEAYLKRIWDTGQLTNGGPLLQEFELKTKQYLDVQNFKLVANGTLALQLALRALDITEGEVITTPFTYVATTSAILWERCRPVYVDIEPEGFCIDVNKIEAAITSETKAILAVHVFGHPCDVVRIQAIADKHKLKVIYDAAHAFGVIHQGKSLFDHGDISIGSFHATKLFQTIEGGCLVARDNAVNENIELLKRFGHTGEDHYQLGINAKASEFEAAMGLCSLIRVDEIIASRKTLTELYDTLLAKNFNRPFWLDNTSYNYGYYPLVFPNGPELLQAIDRLQAANIFPRRYFYPSLNTLPYLDSTQSCPVSEDIASRIMCLPLYVGLQEETIREICQIVSA